MFISMRLERGAVLSDVNPANIGEKGIKMHQRKDDAVIAEVNHKIDKIHERLNNLESISDTLHRIEEWISTVVKVTRMLEIIGDFITRWGVRFGKLAAATAAVWLCIKGCASDLRGFFLR